MPPPVASSTDDPSFWDRLFPSYDAYHDAMTTLLPPVVPLGSVLVPRDVLVLSAWFTPGGGSGLYTRLAIALDDAGVSSSKAVAIWAQLQDQAGAAGGFGGGGYGGSFSWKASEDMVTLLIPNTIRVAIEAQSGGQAVTNVIGVTGGGSGSALAAATAVKNAWEAVTGPIAQLGGQYVVAAYRALDLSSLNGDIAVVSSTKAGTGTAAQLATNGACALVKWNGGTRSRSSRGRLYLGPLRESQINTDGRTLAAATQTAVQTSFEGFRSALASAGFPLCVISPTLSTSFPVTSVAVESVIATQRRRIRS